MSKFCPHYPPPATQRPSAWSMYFAKRRSWLDRLYTRSYEMKMGEVHLPGVDLYMVNEPSLVRRVLVEQAGAFPKHPMLAEALGPLLGESIFTTQGAQWQRQRQLMNPSFEAARVKRVYGLMWAAIQDLANRLAQSPDGSVHDMEREMNHVAADIILRTIVSQPLSGPAAKQVFDAFGRYQALAPRIMMPAFFGLRWLRPWWQVRRSRQAAQDIRTLIMALVRPRYEAAQNRQAADPAPTEHDDILAGLLQVQDPKTGRGFGLDELVDQVAMLFLAGHETSASAMAWTFHLLAHDPEVQSRLAQEAQAHLPLLAPETGAAHVKDLTLARHVFRETLRLFPPVGFLARESAHACTLREKPVQAGATVIISPWLIHRHRQLWSRPDEFDPDRFSDAHDANSTDAIPTRESLRHAYLPFGMGPRVCIGAAFAQQEAALILALLSARFRFEAVPGEVPTPVGRLTIRSEHGIALRVFQRH